MIISEREKREIMREKERKLEIKKRGTNKEREIGKNRSRDGVLKMSIIF